MNLSAIYLSGSVLLRCGVVCETGAVGTYPSITRPGTQDEGYYVVAGGPRRDRAVRPKTHMIYHFELTSRDPFSRFESRVRGAPPHFPTGCLPLRFCLRSHPAPWIQLSSTGPQTCGFGSLMFPRPILSPPPTFFPSKINSTYFVHLQCSPCCLHRKQP